MRNCITLMLLGIVLTMTSPARAESWVLWTTELTMEGQGGIVLTIDDGALHASSFWNR